MSPSIILSQEQVPLGARVYALMPGKDTPQYFKGEPLILRAMLSGIPNIEGGLTKKLYPVKNNVTLENIPENTKFFPVEAFSSKDAPTNARYAVFVNKKLEFPFEVAKSHFNRFYVSTEFPFKEHPNSEKPYFEREIDILSLQLELVKSPDDYLIKELTKYKEEIGKRIVKNGLLDFGISNLKNKSDQVLEVLARRHRDKPSKIISLLERIESSYLRETQLIPYTTELVRVD
ncbi:MAG: hypothetical protein V1815_03230 [Candidatus Woesearchaeota archaeon]